MNEPYHLVYKLCILTLQAYHLLIAIINFNYKTTYITSSFSSSYGQFGNVVAFEIIVVNCAVEIISC